MPRYAERTSVPVQRSRQEIENTLERFGCDSFASGWTRAGRAYLGFRVNGRMYRFEITLPSPDDPEVAKTDGGRHRRGGDLEAARAQLERQRWRALLLVIKAKIEAVQSGIVSFEDEFMSATVMSNGKTLGEWARPQVEQMYRDAGMPALIWEGQ